MRLRAASPVILSVIVLAACSSGSTAPTAGTRCEQGSWTSSAMVAPAQAAIVDPTPTGGGDGARIDLKPDGTFLVDFGPMHPATASFKSGGQDAVMSVVFSGVGKGQWTAVDGSVTATFADLATVRATATIALGQTVPPIFDETLQKIDAEFMLDGAHMGIFTVTSCQGDAMTMTTNFPGGTLTIDAERA